MSKKENFSNWKFHVELQEFERELVDFFVELGNAKWHAKKLCRIAAYIFFHERLTQKQLKELTGYALSTISANINALIAGELKKRRIQGTNEYKYFFEEKLRDYLQEASESRKNEILELNTFLKEKIDELEELIELGEINAEFIHERTIQLFRFTEVYDNLTNNSQSMLPSILRNERMEK